VAHLWSGERGVARMAETPPRAQIRLGHFIKRYKAKSVELTGFEPVTPSLRKMQSNHSDQGKQHDLAGLWSGCGTGHVR